MVARWVALLLHMEECLHVFPLIQSKDMQVRWIGQAKLAIDVNECVCLSTNREGWGKTWQPILENTLP